MTAQAKILAFRKQLQENSQQLDAEAFLSRRLQARGVLTDSIRDARAPTDDGEGFPGSPQGANITSTSVQVASRKNSTIQEDVGPQASVYVQPTDGPPDPGAKHAESMRLNSARTDVMDAAMAFMHGSSKWQPMDIRARSVGALSASTRKWLHIDAYGEFMGEDMDHEQQTKQNTGKLRFYMNVVYNFMAEPGSSRAAMVYSLLMLVVIVVSTVAFLLSTVEPINQADSQAFDRIETICVIVFTVDYVTRLATCPMPKWRFMIMPLNIIDLISIVPWYIGLAMKTDGVNTTSVFRVLRLLRVFRLMRTSPRLSGVTVVLDTLQGSGDVMILMVFFVLMLLVLFSTFMFLLERGTWDDTLGYYVRPREYIFITDDDGNSQPQPSPFSSIPHGFWWAIVTMLTVGYGDVVPVTPGGKAVAMIVMLCGVLTLALPIGVLGTTFTTLWLEHQEAMHRKYTTAPPLIKEMDRCFLEHTVSIEDLVKTYTLVERQVDELRTQLHDKVITWRKSMLGSTAGLGFASSHNNFGVSFGGTVGAHSNPGSMVQQPSVGRQSSAGNMETVSSAALRVASRAGSMSGHHPSLGGTKRRGPTRGPTMQSLHALMTQATQEASASQHLLPGLEHDGSQVFASTDDVIQQAAAKVRAFGTAFQDRNSHTDESLAPTSRGASIDLHRRDSDSTVVSRKQSASAVPSQQASSNPRAAAMYLPGSSPRAASGQVPSIPEANANGQPQPVAEALELPRASDDGWVIGATTQQPSDQEPSHGATSAGLFQPTHPQSFVKKSVQLGEHSQKGQSSSPGPSPLQGPAPDSLLMNQIQEMLGQKGEAHAYDKELDVIFGLQEQLDEKMNCLRDLLRVTGLLRAFGFPEQVKEMRFTYSEIMALNQDSKELRASLDKATDELAQVEMAVADLEARMGSTTNSSTEHGHTPFAQAHKGPLSDRGAEGAHHVEQSAKSRSSTHQSAASRMLSLTIRKLAPGKNDSAGGNTSLNDHQQGPRSDHSGGVGSTSVRNTGVKFIANLMASRNKRVAPEPLDILTRPSAKKPGANTALLDLAAQLTQTKDTAVATLAAVQALQKAPSHKIKPDNLPPGTLSRTSLRDDDAILKHASWPTMHAFHNDPAAAAGPSGSSAPGAPPHPLLPLSLTAEPPSGSRNSRMRWMSSARESQRHRERDSSPSATENGTCFEVVNQGASGAVEGQRSSRNPASPFINVTAPSSAALPSRLSHGALHSGASADALLPNQIEAPRSRNS